MKLLKWISAGLVVCLAAILLAGGVLFFLNGPRRFKINVFTAGPDGCDLGLALQRRGLLSWGVPLDGAAKLRCDEVAQVDEYLSISCDCLKQRPGLP